MAVTPPGRPVAVVSLLLAAIFLPSCVERTPETIPGPLEWTLGFWQWSSSPETLPTGPIDAIYFLVGTIQEAEGTQASGWNIAGGLPEAIPDAPERWMVFRYEYQRVPDPSLVEPLVARIETSRRKRRTADGASTAFNSTSTVRPPRWTATRASLPIFEWLCPKTC